MALVIHFCFWFGYYQGRPGTSSDFVHQLDPNARQLVEYLRGNIVLSAISFEHPLGVIAHFNWLIFVSLMYFFFGLGNVTAIIVFQIIAVSLVTVLFFKITLRHYRSRVIAFVFTFISMVFIDNISWNLWASTECFYRILFFVFYYYLLQLFFIKKNYKYFSLVFFISFFILVFTRIDTIILYLPFYILLIGLGVKYLRLRIKLIIAAAVIGLFSWIILSFDLSAARMLTLGSVEKFYKDGIVVHFYRFIEPFDNTMSGNYLYLFSRWIKLWFYRAYEFFNLMPYRWSNIHKLQYAFFMIIFYFFSFFALLRMFRNKDYHFLFFFLVYVSSAIMHIFLFGVTADLRTTFTHVPFLILTAGYGCDYLFSLFKDKKDRPNGDFYRS